MTKKQKKMLYRILAALALLLAGPALSLPNMLVINSVMGPRKSVAFVSLVILFSTLLGFFYGNW